MGKWADRLAEKTLPDHSEGTDKTAKRGVLSVLAVVPEWIAEKIQPANDCAAPVAILTQTCAGCRHLTRRKTCTEPAAAGLDPPPGHPAGADWFGIRWPPAVHGATCPGFMA